MSDFEGANFATSGSGNVTSLTVPLPVGWVPGQLCILAGNINDAATATLVGPSGWTALDSAPVVVGSSECGGWYRILQSGDSAPAIGITGGSFKASGVTATYSSVDATTPIAAIGARGTRASSSTSTVAPTVTTTAAAQRIVGIFAEKSSTASSATDPAGMTRRAGVWAAGGGQVSALIADEVITSAGATGTRTTTYNVASNAGYGLLFAILDGTPPPPEPGTVVHAWVGAQTTDGFVVVAKTSAATDVRLAVSTSSGMTSPAYSSAETPDADGYVRLTITGLSDDTAHWWQLEDTPSGGSPELIGDIGRASTLPDGPASYSFAFSACQTNNSSSVALDDMLGWDPLFFLHLGDLHYRDPNSTSAAVHRGYIEAQILGASPLAEVLRTIPTYYTRSDHDTTGDNGDNNTTNGLASNAAYRQVVPHPPLAAPTDDSLNYSFAVGRIRFIVLDMRSHYKSTGADAQSSSKTMLGSAQKAWLKAELIEAEPVKVILSDTGWIGAASLLLGTDKWWAYDDERTEIGAYIAAQGLSGSVVMLMGDNHSLLSDDGTNNLWGGFACWGAAPIANVSGGRYITDHQQSYSPFPQEQVRQYGRVSVTDAGGTIRVAFSGWDALNDVERVDGELVVNTLTGKAGTIRGRAGAGTVTAAQQATFAGRAGTVRLRASTGTVTAAQSTTPAGRAATLRLAASRGVVVAAQQTSTPGPAARVRLTSGQGRISTTQNASPAGRSATITTRPGAGTISTVAGGSSVTLTGRAGTIRVRTTTGQVPTVRHSFPAGPSGKVTVRPSAGAVSTVAGGVSVTLTGPAAGIRIRSPQQGVTAVQQQILPGPSSSTRLRPGAGSVSAVSTGDSITIPGRAGAVRLRAGRGGVATMSSVLLTGAPGTVRIRAGAGTVAPDDVITFAITVGPPRLRWPVGPPRIGGL